MRIFVIAPRRWRALTVPFVLAGALAAIAPAASASAATCASWTAAQPASPGTITNQLSAVSVLSSCNAWAVGFTASAGQADQVLTEHWDGSSWTVFPGENPSNVRNRLQAVSAVSATDIWAVGRVTNGSDDDLAVIEHWNGASWSVAFAPDPGVESGLNGVHAVSANDVWAVGFFNNGTGDQTLIEHWNGRTWAQVASPSPGAPAAGDILTAVAASSHRDAWAVGKSDDGRNDHTLVLHWNGTSWKHVISPDPGTSNVLSGVSVTGTSNAWAVGESFNGTSTQTLVLHWNGTRWTHTPSPSPGTDGELLGVAATSAGNAWAVGDRLDATQGGTADDTLILHWNGRSWTTLHSPDPGAENGSVLVAVAAAAAGNAWAVGTFGTAQAGQALAVHCC